MFVAFCKVFYCKMFDDIYCVIDGDNEEGRDEDSAFWDTTTIIGIAGSDSLHHSMF